MTFNSRVGTGSGLMREMIGRDRSNSSFIQVYQERVLAAESGYVLDTRKATRVSQS